MCQERWSPLDPAGTVGFHWNRRAVRGLESAGRVTSFRQAETDAYESLNEPQVRWQQQEFIMSVTDRRLLLIKIGCWLGIAADALWAVALFIPKLFGMLAGLPDFNPGLQFRLSMAIGGTLMTGWTFLLLWVIRKPIERRFVILLTAFPVVIGLFIVALFEVLEGNTFQTWILVKTSVVFVSLIGSYILAGNIARELKRDHN